MRSTHKLKRATVKKNILREVKAHASWGKRKKPLYTPKNSFMTLLLLLRFVLDIRLLSELIAWWRPVAQRSTKTTHTFDTFGVRIARATVANWNQWTNQLLQNGTGIEAYCLCGWHVASCIVIGGNWYSWIIVLFVSRAVIEAIRWEITIDSNEVKIIERGYQAWICKHMVHNIHRQHGTSLNLWLVGTERFCFRRHVQFLY